NNNLADTCPQANHAPACGTVWAVTSIPAVCSSHAIHGMSFITSNAVRLIAAQPFFTHVRKHPLRE
ncbi:hypothetical protein, partial [Salinibius halmophilus]|uniref:hypothetical protein n=1 Tax=Salinibius halmophilus TaxID=1853216 RepID=UPI001F379A8F